MNHTTIFRTATIFLGALALVAYAGMGPANAQKLKCKGCVSSKQLKNGGIKPKDLHPSAKPSGADFADGPLLVTLDNDNSVVIRSVTITAAGAGMVIVNATGYFSGPSTATVGIECGISTGTTAEAGYKIVMASKPDTVVTSLPIALTRGYEVDTGVDTYNLVCKRVSGVTMGINNPSLTAIFVPGRV